MTQLIGVIGYPLKHSLSPIFHQAALDYYNLDIRYMLWETENSDLPSRVDDLRKPQYLGANVTVPYKERIIQLIDEVDISASFIGSINTIVNRNGKLIGHNTDSYGFMQALETEADYNPEGKNALVLGAGGVARAVLISLIQKGVHSLFIANRTRSRAENLREYVIGFIYQNKYATDVKIIDWQYSSLQSTATTCGLIVNCTSIGMKYSAQEKESPLSQNMIPGNALVYDLVYNPLETPLLKAAKAAGAGTLNGLPMLVYQGAAGFKLWTGRDAPLDIMFSAVNNYQIKYD